MCEKLIVIDGEKLESKTSFFNEKQIDLFHAYAMFMFFDVSEESFKIKTLDEKCEFIVLNYEKYEGDFKCET